MSVVANVAINVDSRNAVSKLRQVQTQSQATERAVEGLSRAFGGLAAAFGAGFALTKVIADVRELDTNLRRLGTVGVDVGKISPALSALSKELGGVASKAELAAASYQAASAGFSDTAGNINILRAATKAATGGLADTQAVTEVLVKTLNSYGLAGDQATKVTDSISKAVELGNQEWSDYTSQLGRVASIAALAGVSLDEVNAFIASATKNGATAEVAFTGLGATLNTLLQPTKESQEAAAKLGIAWNYGGLQAKGFTGLMAELAIAMEKDKETTAKLLGSQEAMRGAFAANAKGGRDYKMVLEELSGATGKTDADFQILKVSLDNQLKALDTAFKNLSEALGTAFGPTVVKTISDVATAINVIADALNAVPQPAKTATAELLKLVAQIILLDKAIKAVIGLRVAFVAAMGGMTTATVASAGAAKTGAGAFALYANNTRIMQSQAAAATPVMNGLLGTLRNLAAIGAIAIVVNVAVTGMAAVYQAQAEIDRLRGVRSKGGAAAAFAGSATAEQKQEQKKVLEAIRKERESTGFRNQQAAAAAGVGKTMARQRADQLAEREASARAILALPTRGQSVKPASNAMGTPVGATVGGGGRAAGGASKAADEAKRLAEELQRSTEQGNDLFRQFSRQAVLLGITSETERKRLQIQYDYQDRAREINELKNAEQKVNLMAVNDEIKRLETLELQTEELKKQLQLFYELAGVPMGEMLPGGAGAFRTDINLDPSDRAQQKIDEYKEKLAELQDPINMAQRGAQAIGDAFSSSFQGIITGTQSVQEALASFFQNVAKSFIDMATEIIAQMVIMYAFKQLLGLFGGGATGIGSVGNFSGAFSGTASSFNPSSFGMDLLPGRAKGGPVSGGQMYMVGERGPELFVPGRSGTIIPNDKMGGGGVNVVVNVDAKGSSVEGNEQGANQLGRVISAAVQSELIKQQRPGGLLAR